MWSVHQRLAELWFIQSFTRELTSDEKDELKICLDANMREAQKLADLYNLSLIASMTDDTKWNLELCSEIDKIKDKFVDI